MTGDDPFATPPHSGNNSTTRFASNNHPHFNTATTSNNIHTGNLGALPFSKSNGQLQRAGSNSSHEQSATGDDMSEMTSQLSLYPNLNTRSTGITLYPPPLSPEESRMTEFSLETFMTPPPRYVG